MSATGLEPRAEILNFVGLSSFCLFFFLSFALLDQHLSPPLFSLFLCVFVFLTHSFFFQRLGSPEIVKNDSDLSLSGHQFDLAHDEVLSICHFS